MDLEKLADYLERVADSLPQTYAEIEQYPLTAASQCNKVHGSLQGVALMLRTEARVDA